MKYAGLIKNDLAAGSGVCVSVYTQGCPHHCIGCHNPETWDFNGGRDFTEDTLNEILRAMSANHVSRNLCMLGGEPMCAANLDLTELVIKEVKQHYPDTKVYIWTGYLLDELTSQNSMQINNILQLTDIIIDGRFDINQRDLTLPLRGSVNQRILYKGKDF